VGNQKSLDRVNRYVSFVQCVILVLCLFSYSVGLEFLADFILFAGFLYGIIWAGEVYYHYAVVKDAGTLYRVEKVNSWIDSVEEGILFAWDKAKGLWK